MRCRHTVPEWHRYVVAEGAGRPIFAACRLLVKDGEPAADPSSIACAYWGRQPDCPVYEGPESRPAARLPNADEPVTSERVWPVRPPGAPDGNRVLLMVLGWLSIALLGWALILSLAALLGKSIGTGYFLVILIGAALSLVTHVLNLVRLWVRR